MGQFDDIQFINQAQLKQVMLANADKADKRYVKKSEFDPNSFVPADAIGALASKDNVGVEDLDAALAAIIAAKADADDVTTMDDVNAAIATAVDGLGELAKLDEVTEADLSSAVQNKINDVYTKSEVYTKEQTDDAIDAKINAKVSSVYKPAGTVEFAELPEASADIVGNVYSVSDDFVTTDAFVEGAGVTIGAGTNVVVIEVEEGVFKYDVLATSVDLSNYVQFDDITVASSNQITEIIDSIYEGMDINDDPQVADIVLPAGATGFAAISNAFKDENVTTVNLKLNSDVTVPDRDDGKVSTTFINAGQTVNVDLNGHDVNVDSYAFYVNGGTLTLSDSTGKATIKTRRLDATYPAIQVSAGTCILDGVNIDCTDVEVPEGHNNWTYGAVTSGDGVVRMNSGSIKTYEAACMSICNGTAAGVGAKFIIGGNSKLTTVTGPAIYMADQKDVVIKDNAVIEGGIVARMGNFEIKDNARVINNLDNADNFGVYLTQSGTEATPAGIMVLGGCYKSAGTSNNDMNISISGNATVESVLGEAIGIAKLDTLYDQNITVSVEDSSKLTAAEGFDKVKIYSHDDLAAIVEAAGKTLAPAATTTAVLVTVDGAEFYNDVPAPEPQPEPEPENP